MAATLDERNFHLEVDTLQATRAPIMEVSTLDVYLMTDIVKRALFRFLDLWKSENGKLKKSKYIHMDVKMSKEYGGHYSIQLTNYGYCDNNQSNILNILRYIFNNLISIKCYKNILAVIYLKDEQNDFEIVYDLHYPPKKHLRLVKNEENKHIDLISCRKYLSIVLSYKLTASDVEKFKATVLELIASLCRENPTVKVTYRKDKNMLHNNHVPLDDEYKACQILSTAVTDIVRQSLDSEFKEKSFALLKTENPGQLRDLLMTQLLPLIHENYIFSTKQEEE
ncbi:uncharacterized protein LOC122524204 isoform X2 [Polistes fuscatus]|uniref:uncharacterized protein LOC122524204 isoform X2 n=1 Tax=Polistes fuscatus TaxID=30207 RepID=UPI001CA9FBF3|nr:uncharacterized protein LOC122524204 isoform X2 [Polistes fuscatus]